MLLLQGDTRLYPVLQGMLLFSESRMIITPVAPSNEASPPPLSGSAVRCVSFPVGPSSRGCRRLPAHSAAPAASGAQAPPAE